MVVFLYFYFGAASANVLFLSLLSQPWMNEGSAWYGLSIPVIVAAICATIFLFYEGFAHL